MLTNKKRPLFPFLLRADFAVRSEKLSFEQPACEGSVPCGFFLPALYCCHALLRRFPGKEKRVVMMRGHHAPAVSQPERDGIEQQRMGFAAEHGEYGAATIRDLLSPAVRAALFSLTGTAAPAHQRKEAVHEHPNGDGGADGFRILQGRFG